ncbi:hypothetical protein [Nonomuraea sp. NPDC050310]|uniref:hypothetical protein n=1 Tax=Nonomuraea sp. NPDC050310 TaxID=3154935 RepID=UPI00340F2C62
MPSGLYVSTLQDVLDTTQLALDLDREDHKVALYTSSKTQDYNADSAYSSTNEITGTGYASGGKAITGTALSLPGAGVLRYSSDAVSWPSSTLTGVAKIDMYAAALAGLALILGIDLGTTYNTSDGTLLVSPHANGLLTVDCTP